MEKNLSALGFMSGTSGDGVDNSADAFPDDSSESLDTDSDGEGDNSDNDDDGDGWGDGLTEEDHYDCDDSDPTVYPSAAEIYDGKLKPTIVS
mgnify:CR=1 FL=1